MADPLLIHIGRNTNREDLGVGLDSMVLVGKHFTFSLIVI